MDNIQKVQVVEKKSGLATAGLVCGIIAIVFAFIPVVNFVSYVLGALALIFGIIAVVKKSSGKAIAALVLGALSLIIAILMNILVFQAAKVVLDEANKTIDKVQEDQKENTSKWTQEIYDSITTAETSFDDNYNLQYTGGTQFSEIEAKVGAPSSTTSAAMNDSESITASWTTLDFSGNGKSLSISITYDKNSGQITSKSKIEM